MLTNTIEFLQFRGEFDFVTEDSACFKPSSYPPKNSFPMSIDKNGKVISRYGDDTWDFKVYKGRVFYFRKYDNANKALFKKLMFYYIYSPLFPGKYISLTKMYEVLQTVFKACSEHNIQACQLSRFPKVIELIAKAQAQGRFKPSVSFFNNLLNHQKTIGFCLLNKEGIALYSRFDPKFECGQYPYIPPRLWTKFISRVDEILDDFLLLQNKIEKSYRWISSSYINNARAGFRKDIVSPFSSKEHRKKIRYEGTFEMFLKEYGLYDWVAKYQEPEGGIHQEAYTLKQYAYLLNNIVYACSLYVLFYSIMRKGEIETLRIDCLQIDEDIRLGKVYLLVGETTKTDPDADARWVVNHRVEKAINVAKKMIEWKYCFLDVPFAGEEAPYLFQRVDVWSTDGNNTNYAHLGNLKPKLKKNAKLFLTGTYTIEEEDYRKALALTPSLSRKAWFQVDREWNFSLHQFRRTLAVMFALNNISAATSQFQMKHKTREQQYHYMQNHGRLRLNGNASDEVITEFYNEMGRQIILTAKGDEKALPHKKSPINDKVMNFITQGEIDRLKKAQKKGEVGYRKNLLGGCMKRGSCEYGGFDTIAHCSGGNGGNMCTDLVIDASKQDEFKEDKRYYQAILKSLPEESPRYNAVKAEVIGYKKVIAVVECQGKS